MKIRKDRDKNNGVILKNFSVIAKYDLKKDAYGELLYDIFIPTAKKDRFGERMFKLLKTNIPITYQTILFLHRAATESKIIRYHDWWKKFLSRIRFLDKKGLLIQQDVYVKIIAPNSEAYNNEGNVYKVISLNFISGEVICEMEQRIKGDDKQTTKIIIRKLPCNLEIVPCVKLKDNVNNIIHSLIESGNASRYAEVFYNDETGMIDKIKGMVFEIIKSVVIYCDDYNCDYMLKVPESISRFNNINVDSRLVERVYPAIDNCRF